MERRNTRQRQLILDAVRSRCDHPTAEQIHKQVAQIDPKLSLGTVYRNLQLLAQNGDILAIRLPNASDRFDLTTFPHNHFLCRSCGQLLDINITYDDSIDNTVSEDGYVIESHQTVFSGLCPNCR